LLPCEWQTEQLIDKHSIVYKKFGVSNFFIGSKMEGKVCRTCGKRTNAERSLNIFEKRNQTTLEHIKLLTGAVVRG